MCEGRDQHPVGPGLRDHGVRFGLIEQVGALVIQLTGLLGCPRAGEGLIGVVELLVKVIDIVLQGDEFLPHILILLQRDDGLRRLFAVYLRLEGDSDDDDISIQRGFHMLIEHEYHPGRVAANVILRDVEIPYDGHAFQIGRDLFQCLFFRLLRGESDRVNSGFSLGHAMLSCGRHRANLGETWPRPGKTEEEAYRCESKSQNEARLS